MVYGLRHSSVASAHRHPSMFTFTRSVLRTRGFEGVEARPIRRVDKEFVRSDLPLREPVNDRLGTTGRSSGRSWLTVRRNNRTVSQNRPSLVRVAMLFMMWVESSLCIPVRIPSAWIIRSVVSSKASRPQSRYIRRTRKLCSVWGSDDVHSGSIYP